MFMRMMFPRFLFAPDDGGGMGGSTEGAATASTGDPAGGSTEGTPVAATQAAAPTQQPTQQDPDWNSLGVPFDQAQQRLQYFEQLNKRYESDPTWAQQFDKLYGGQEQQQPQAHPYDWMMDEKLAAERREKGEAHPDHGRLTQEFTNFFHNQPGHLANLVNHPKVVEAMYKSMAPMVQDMAQRMIQQQVGPMQQYLHQQGEQQFRAHAEKTLAGLPEQVRAMFNRGMFGAGQQGLKAAVEAAKLIAPQQPDPNAQPVPPGKGPPAKAPVNKNNATTKETEAEELERFAREMAGGRKK